MWHKGNIGEYTYEAKVYGEGSQYGIDEGKISKMSIRKNGKELYNYDRGLDFNRLDTDGEEIYATLLKKYN